MSKSVSIRQSHSVVSTLINNVNWDELDGDVLQEIVRNPRKAGEQFTTFLKKGFKAIIGRSILIDRSKPFDPVEFIGEKWSIVEEDKRSLALTHFNLTSVHFETCLKKGENWIKGEEKIKRLKEVGYIRLDAKIFQTLWENKHLIPETWKKQKNVFFDGTILNSSSGHRSILRLYWFGDRWNQTFQWLEGSMVDEKNVWGVVTPSAVL